MLGKYGKQDEIIYCIKEAGRDGLGYLCIEALSTSYSFMGRCYCTYCGRSLSALFITLGAGNVRLLNVRLLTVFITGSCLLSCCVKELPYAQYFPKQQKKILNTLLWLDNYMDSSFYCSL